MMENLCTIKGKNGEIRQGAIRWLCSETFMFHEGSCGSTPFWGKTDYWEILAQEITVYKITVI